MKTALSKLTDFFREDNGGLSCIRLSLLFLVMVLIPGFILLCIYCEHLQSMAGELFMFVGGLAGVKSWQKGMEAKEECAVPTSDDGGKTDMPAADSLDFDGALGLTDAHDAVLHHDTIPQACIDLILQEEGIDQPYLVPPGDSGVSIGRGYDLGYEEHFRQDWAGQLSDSQINRLAAALGKKGAAARAIASRFRDIRITGAQADEVFHLFTLPREIAKTRAAFPGYDHAPEIVQGVLVSLVYNRGTQMKDSPGSNRRLEMRQIRDAVVAGHYKAIPGYLREMKRLWPAGSGLIRRREAEAKLVETCL
jgi:GH24 family phage-related lysozyme (muramidase)